MYEIKDTLIPIPDDSDFTLHNIPFGVMRRDHSQPVVATRIGNTAIDLHALAMNHLLDDTGTSPGVFQQPVLNPFIALGQPVWRAVRQRLIYLFSDPDSPLASNHHLLSQIATPIHGVEMLMPLHVGDYTDFYSSLEHATNVGIMFRDASNPLLPNWKHIPVGYHGRSSSIVVSGTPVHRPNGQTNPDNSPSPVFGPSRQVDFELEMAFVTGISTRLGDSISTDDAEEAIFGMVLFNDLSARDIQKWEYVPLGPFLGKNFGSIISPWVVTLDALEPFRVQGPPQDPSPLPYLQFTGKKSFDIHLEVAIKTPQGRETTVCRSNFRRLYWNMAQQLAHHTVNGCNINVGDLYGSGTISGHEAGSFGSMLELAWKETRPITLADGTSRTFLNDHDTVIIRGFAKTNGIRVGFGEAVTTILPAKPIAL